MMAKFRANPATHKKPAACGLKMAGAIEEKQMNAADAHDLFYSEAHSQFILANTTGNRNPPRQKYES